MKESIAVKIDKPQYITVTDITFAQVDSWFGHTKQDLKMNIIFPEIYTAKKYPCIIWICGGAWLSMDKSIHLAYLSKLAMAGFVVASIQYRTSNEATYPSQIQDIKAGIRYLKAHSKEYNIDEKRFGVMGESAGGYLSAMAAFNNDKSLDVGEYLEYSSEVNAVCMWYSPINLTKLVKDNPASPESLMLGGNLTANLDDVLKASPISYVTKNAPPCLIIHGTKDNTVPFSQSQELYDKLEQCGGDVTFLAVEGADHADIHFFQDEIWNKIISFFKHKMRVFLYSRLV